MDALVRESMVQGEQLKLVIKYHKGINWTPISLQDKECFSQCLVIRNRYKKKKIVEFRKKSLSLLIFNSAENIQIAFKTSILKHWLVLI